jgi:hypothetical protein
MVALAACGGGGKRSTTTTTTRPAPATTATSAAATGPKLQAPTATARKWLAAIAAGDDAAAIALTSQRSLDKVGGAAGFKKMDIALAEGWGGWGRAKTIDVTTVGVQYPPTVTIVVLHGSIEQEGPARETWAALPIVATDAGDRVEPFVDYGPMTPKQADGSTVAADQLFEVTVPNSVDAYVILDDHASELVGVLSADQAGQHLSYSAPDRLGAGAHGLTVVLVGTDGVQARTFQYKVS